MLFILLGLFVDLVVVKFCAIVCCTTLRNPTQYIIIRTIIYTSIQMIATFDCVNKIHARVEQIYEIWNRNTFRE